MNNIICETSATMPASSLKQWERLSDFSPNTTRVVVGWLERRSVTIVVLLVIIKLYQYIISRLFPQSCRFYPSCSCYCAEALERYGLWLGAWFGLKRILRCHPWNLGGYDPVMLPQDIPEEFRKGKTHIEIHGICKKMGNYAKGNYQ